jgi:hypothetical protein
LELEFINVTKEVEAPDIFLSFRGLCSINAFKNPKKIRKDQPYSLKPGGGNEDFDLRQHLGVVASGPSSERFYKVVFRAEADAENAGGDPGDTEILIEC